MKVVVYEDEWLGNESVGKRENEIAALPTGNQAIHLHKQPLFPKLNSLSQELAFVPRYTSHPSK